LRIEDFLSFNLDYTLKTAVDMIRAFNNVLVVIKQTPYEQYVQLKNQGRAPVALRWERLLNRYQVHQKCVSDLENLLKKIDIKYTKIGREELHRGLLTDKDLVIAVGGDGTCLNTSSYIDDSIPVLGINSDPTREEERGVTNAKDERRSRGALCALTATNLAEHLPKILYGEVSAGLRSRIQCLVRSTQTETRLPPALNDILVAHPIPAAVSRFRLALCRGNVISTYKTDQKHEEVLFYLFFAVLSYLICLFTAFFF
jgi:NAD+ kinase